MWIVQEITLAERVLFISPSTSASRETVGVVCAALSLIATELNKDCLSRPHFVSRSTWQVLSLANGFESKYSPIARVTLCRNVHIWRRTASAKGRQIMNTMLARTGYICGASHPKDHVYGTLGISSLRIVPDYSSDKSVGDVYVEFVTAIMEGDKESGLFFLSMAGIGLFENNLKLPSWVPNFPEISQGTSSMAYSGNASFGIFGSDVPIARISGQILSVAGIQVQTLSHLGASPTVEGCSDKRFLSFIRDFSARHPKYATGIPTLQAIYRAVTTSTTYGFNVSNLLRAQTFVHFLMNNVFVKHDDVENIRRKLVGFGLPLSGPDAHFDISNTFFSHIDIGPDEIESTSAKIGIPDSMELYQEEISNARMQLSRDLRVNEQRRLFETDSGYLGLAPEKAAEGDLVCILSGYEMVALLPKCDSSYIFVGPCFVLGLMGGEVMAYLDAGQTKIKIFDIK